MNKKFLSAVLFGALMVTSTGTFVSCKDYDDDIDRIDNTLNDLKSQIAALQTAVDNGKWITDVTPTSDGLTITMNDGRTFNITNGKNGAQGEKGVDGSKLTLDAEGQWLIDGEPTGWYCAKKGETATVIVPEVGNDGYWYFVNKETGKLEKSTIKAAPVTAVEADGICTLTVVNPDGTTTVVKLPTTAASITELEIVGYLNAAGQFTAFSNPGTADNKYEMNSSAFYAKQKYEWEWKDKDGSQKVSGSMAEKTALVSLEGASLVVRVAPASADLSTVSMNLINSQLKEAPIALGAAKAYKGLVARDASANGLWSVPMSSEVLSDVGSLQALKQNFFIDANGNGVKDATEKNIAFALKTPSFISNYNLAFNNIDLKAANAFINDDDHGLVKDEDLTHVGNTIYYTGKNEKSNSDPEDRSYISVKLGATNTFYFDVPTSIYKSQIIVDEFEAQNWGVKIEGNTFTVNKYFDKATIPSFPVYFNYIELVNDGSIKSVTQTVYIRLERSISADVTLDAKAWTINAVPSKDNFTAPLKKMYDAMSAEELTNWKEFVSSYDYDVYQVNADGPTNISRYKQYGQDGTNGSKTIKDMVSLINSNGAIISNAVDAASIKVNLNQEWPTNLAFDKEYYVLVSFKDSKGDVLSTAKLPFTVNIPELSTFLVKQQGVFNGTNDGTAYIFSKDYNVADNDVVAMQYDLTYGFVKLAEKLAPTGATATTLTFKTNGFINGDDKNSEGKIVGLAAMSGANQGILVPGQTNVNASDAILMAQKGKNGKVYGQKFVVEVADAKYVGKYAYSDNEKKAQKFTITMKSPIKEGSISAADGSKTIAIDATDQQKIVESRFLAKTYSTAGTKYQLFPSDATKKGSSIYEWIKYNDDATITITSKDDKVLKVKEIKNTQEGEDGYEGYVKVEPVNPAYDTTGDITVTVNDVWGFSISQDITINVKR
ncbi:hypothetical protein HUT37_03075 [Bacteroides sartorii]|uniref:PL29 family lyase N-terminal domain-containing protein n=1 Tax=Phocaeicola sartorii TaxID=671267 RepID=UPI0015858C4A|nr:PL29 family lyase N-terminal domain-containing protein [Phocaeicola sartorii]NUK97894.1 hypothetical protein [Phocaeicola sartorii]